MTRKHFIRRWRSLALALPFFIFSALFAAAQDSLPFEDSLPQTEPASSNETVDSAQDDAPDELPLPNEMVDLEYPEPAEEPDYDAMSLTRPPSSENLFQRMGNALYGYLSAPAETRHREPLRHFDWELFTANVNVANTLVGATDILKETIKISGTELASRADGGGFRLNTDVLFRSGFDINGDDKGFGMFVTMDGSVNMDVSDDLLSLLAQGNAGNTSMSGSLSVSGAVFADVGFHHYFDIDKWRVDIRPAWFLPLVYVPQSDVSFILDTDDRITVGAFGSMTAYMPVNLDSGMLTNIGGLDFSASVEYALFPILDVGLGITHIPFMPARLTNKVNASINESILDHVSIIDILKDPDSLSLDFSPDYSSSSAEIYVTRPFNMNAWFLYRPLRTDLLTVKPNMGFTTNTPSGITYFNVGLALELNVARVFFLRLQSGCEDGIWRHGAGVALNLHIIQLDIEAALSSQEYLPAWSGRGLTVGIGLHVGA
jgi:hypothetical protein